MECNFWSPQMLCPQPIFRGLLSTLYPIPETCLIFCPNKHLHLLPKPSLLPLRLYSCSSAALKTIEYNNPPTSDSELIDLKTSKFRLANGSQRMPRTLNSGNLKLPKDKGLECPTRTCLDVDHRFGRAKLDMKKQLKWFSEMLRNCAANMRSNEGKAIHGELIKLGIEPDTHLWISLINFYAKCGSLCFARKAFDEMPDSDVVSWTALISGFVAAGHGGEGVQLFSEMWREGVSPNEFTLATVLKGCSVCSDLEFGKQLHAVVVKGRVISDLYVGSALVDLYAKCGEMECAEKVFFVMPEHNVVSWNALLSGYAKVGDGDKVLILFCRMTESEMRFSNYTLSTVLKGCASLGNLRGGQVVHSMAIKIGSEFDDFVSCSLVDMYSKGESTDDALQVFKRIRDPDIVTWSTIISSLDQQGHKLEATKLFHLMRCSGLRPNQFSLSSIASAAPGLGDVQYCKSIHACIYRFGFESETLVSNALISMYMKIGLVYDGCQVFCAMDQKDVVSWNALLSGFHDNQTSEQGLIIFRDMLAEGLEPNKYTFISILRSCSTLSNINFGKQLHAQIIKVNLDTDNYVGTSLIDMYSKCRCLEDVEVIFNRLNERDIFTWTVLISCYAQTQDRGEKAIESFNQMQREGFKANEFTLASCLRGCSGLACLQTGQQLHSWLVKSGQCCDVYVASALVDMYGKCGCTDDAETIFKSMETVDTVMWNTIICGYTQNGKDKQALQSFRTMLNKGVLPDGVTFIGVLSAHSHMGLVEEGRKLFNSMSELYGITPTVDHCSCMIDILGRAGRFKEVESFIEQMNVSPNALVWETVLGACTIHGNLELGERVAQKLFEIEPKMDSHYILLSNIYAAKGRWDDVSRVRRLMSSQGLKKEPGCSWVEVDAQTHIFLSQDASHPKIQDIYQKLEELHEKLFSAGYIPNTDYVLHNVPDREKKENLFHHSERLALAFALLSNKGSGKVRIFKNLRICGDCHEFMKRASNIIDLDIVVRDIGHFHHFHNGICSCKDYW